MEYRTRALIRQGFFFSAGSAIFQALQRRDASHAMAKDHVTDRWAESNLHLQISSPECLKCRHYGANLTCLAFPAGIPEDIIGQRILHRDPIPGDGGIQFEELTKAGPEGASNKRARLLELARRRQSSRWPPHRCVGDYHSGVYECDYVSPYTKSAQNVDASIMVLLQDWASDAELSGEIDTGARDLGYSPTNQTNIRLKKLLHDHLGLTLADTYATNVFPFVKLGAMNADVPMRDLVRAAAEFAIPQIEIVAPRIAVCLGKAAYNAVRRAAGRHMAKTLEEAISSPFSLGSTQVWCQAHTGSIGTNNRNKGGVDRVTADWQRMAMAHHITRFTGLT